MSESLVAPGYLDALYTRWGVSEPQLPMRPELAFALRMQESQERQREQLRDAAGRDLAQQLFEVRNMAARALATGRMPDSELRALAKRRAELLGDLLGAISAPRTAVATLAWLCSQVEPLQGRPFAFEGDRPQPDQLRGFMARAQCPLWWRRQLRRAAVLDREREGRAAGEVCASRRQPYVTHDTLHRHQQRKAANAAMMAATELENDAGQVVTIADAAAASVSNKAIRRGELMTRISGCERLAVWLGLRGMFLTLTAPSRFHSMLRHGGKNPRHDGSTPKDAQAWLCAAWARARAKLQRLGLQLFGFRVAEPHHDGCPHWHALLWAKPADYDQAVDIIRAAWLKHEGDEPGAAEHRCKAVAMHAGGAAGYIAKYIAKNIDDAGAVAAEGHRDDDYGDAVPQPAQADAFGGTAQRVEAWASANGIRQFQAIGQPPVTVWRELRRIPEQAQQGATKRMAVAFEAANRKRDRRADWAAYVLAQGGLWKGRDYLLRIANVLELRAGRYEETEQPRPRGVYDTTGPGDWHISERREWRPRGEWSKAEQTQARGIWAPRRPPWTRVNNCTQLPGLTAARQLREAGLLTSSEPGKVSTDERTHHAQSPPDRGRPVGPP